MTDPLRKGLIDAYRKLMRPLVRILIRNNVSYGEFVEILKATFVEVAEHDFCLVDREASQSRVAILTGLTRKEVARQKALLESGELLINTNLNRMSRVLEGWHTDTRFTGPYGVPIELPFDGNNGVNFCALVRGYSGDMAPRAMLDELLRLRVVERQPGGVFRIMMRAYIPESLHPDALERLGRVLCNFVNTYEFNMEKTAPGAGRFERVVRADNGLRKELMPAFDRLIRWKGQQLLEELDNWLSTQESTAGPRSLGNERVKTGVGIYHFIEQDDEPPLR
jgi:hypothetical protein